MPKGLTRLGAITTVAAGVDGSTLTYTDATTVAGTLVVLPGGEVHFQPTAAGEDTFYDKSDEVLRTDPSDVPVEN